MYKETLKASKEIRNFLLSLDSKEIDTINTVSEIEDSRIKRERRETSKLYKEGRI